MLPIKTCINVCIKTYMQPLNFTPTVGIRHGFLSEANSIFLVITTKILPRWSLPSKIYVYAFFFCFLKRSNLFCFLTLYLFFLLSCHLYMKILWYICIHIYYLLLIIKKVFIVDSLLETRRYLIRNQFWCINTNS